MEVIHSLKVYECTDFFLLTGHTRDRGQVRAAKIHKGKGDLVVSELALKEQELPGLIQDLKDQQGLKLVCAAQVLLGFMKFVMGYYIYLVTKKAKVGKIRSHSLYKAEEIQLIKLFPEKETRDEKRCRQIFERFDFASGFYFSHTYDLTCTLQENVSYHFSKPLRKPAASGVITRSMTNLLASLETPIERREHYPWKTMYVWNHAQLLLVLDHFKDKAWVAPVIHGYIGYQQIAMLGRLFDMLVIARRSRHFAGTRYLKRGVNEEGRVANDVETEQILVDRAHPKGGISSYVQVRGSIPLFWCQDANSMLPQPPIIRKLHIVNQVDHMAEATRKHFADLFLRYGEPIICLSLLKSNEKHPRESPLSNEFHQTTDSLSEPMPQEFKILFEDFDMKSELKNRETCIGKLTAIATTILARTGLFSCTRQVDNTLKICYQVGVVRTNCIDCIDRTNAAQLAIANLMLQHQLSMMGIFDSLSKKCKIVQLLTELFEEMGDELARQYAGSAAHQNLRKHNGPSKIFTSIKRHWSNLITDAGKQQAMNLILGVYQPGSNPVPLWDIQDDSILHRTLNFRGDQAKTWWENYSLKFKKNLGLKKEYESDGKKWQRSSAVAGEVKPGEPLPPQYTRTDIPFAPVLTLPPSTSITSFDRKFYESCNRTFQITLEAEVAELVDPRPKSETLPKAKFQTSFPISTEELTTFEEYLHPEDHLQGEVYTFTLTSPYKEEYVIDVETLLEQADKPEMIQRTLAPSLEGENLLAQRQGGSLSFDSMYSEESPGGKALAIIEDHFIAPVKVFKERKRTFT